ncbi:ribonucleoside-diphosphate reductase subunit alpha [Kitasatospora cheerisanensis]|uniref:Ribonucleoside-diphosphate reductase n=1 Tax=Kitasatospora cheerisanensis KCTC 2395 TaxID=1348663 RepID=A0A066YZQ6_9ACTN|nr:ribonucleoside-diphosphate reductase subunit alpha [Kitasatospora cheerisanensis]KDN83415.1 ribonucleoside-diphosphate reductase [Kitasatospora cheerisanensis KCTC 2395]
MTVAASVTLPSQGSADAFTDPGAALLRLLTDRSTDLPQVDPGHVAAAALRGRHAGSDFAELRGLAVEAAASMIAEDPQYSKLAARLLAMEIADEAATQGVASFSDSIAVGHAEGLIGDATAELVAAHAALFDSLIDASGDDRFEYFGLRTVQSRYLLRHPITRKVVETPQHFLLRVAAGLAVGATEESVREVAELYRLMSRLEYLTSSPTLFNSGTRHPQMSSCYLLDSPLDNLDSIYNRYAQIARLSKHAGGIGLSYSRIRSRGSLIRGTNGKSNGIVPFLRTLDSSVAAVNQGGRRKGAACVYLETWHADIEEFLELRDNTGEEARRTHNLNLAHWIPDEFMRRVNANEDWSLFSPADVPELVDLWGADFDEAYRKAELAGKAVRTIPAQTLYARMMRTLAQTGNGWMTFKDASNRAANQTALPGRTVHSSNLCTEILEVTDDSETAVCNLGSVNLGAHVAPGASADDLLGAMDWERLDATVRTAVTFLDRVIDINFYPTTEAGASNSRWRPVGLGVMGLQDVFFKLRLDFDSAEAKALSTLIAERIMLTAYERSADLAEQFGRHEAYGETRAARGQLHIDHFFNDEHSGSAAPQWAERWDALRARIADTGLRNSLLLAIAPTATIASIAGVYECIEPQVSNLFKRETLSGEFLQVNPYLVRELKELGVWDQQTRDALRDANGSVQDFKWLPESVRSLYRTAWELPQRALIDLAAARQPYIDQSQSLNLFMAAPTIGKLSSMYAYAWKVGLKTTYYLRSRPATRIAQAASGAARTAAPVPVQTPTLSQAEQDAIACSLENPESCEACQ